jgi:hypothetical protein
MRQTAATGCRVSAHTHPSPVATANGDTGKPIRATIARWFSGSVDFGGSPDVVQPDAATATPTAMAATSRNQIGART